MDDKGLQNPKPQTTSPPPAATDDQIDKPVGQPPVPPTPLPPPSIPSMPPVAPAGTPPPDDSQPIPTEDVKISKPKRRLGKNAKKIVGGMLVMTLLVGGVYVVNLTRETAEERQVVESEAVKPNNQADCVNAGCTGVKGQYWAWVKIDGVWQCKKRKSQTKCQDVVQPNQKCGSLSGGACENKNVGEPCKKGNIDGTCIHSPGYHPDAVTSGEMPCTCQSTGDPVEASPLPTPTPTPTPSPTPSPGPELSCVGLRSDTDPIEYGDTVTFTCEGSFSSASNPYAQFYGSVNEVGIYSSPNMPIDLITNTASYEMEINEHGDWLIQCRVCADGVGCTEWGQATSSGGIGGTTPNPAPGTLGGMCGGIAVIACESGLTCQYDDPPHDPMPDASGICVEPTTR